MTAVGACVGVSAVVVVSGMGGVRRRSGFAAYPIGGDKTI
ncbi:hypothetical protein VNG_1239H [Halobacterium salinarum NRC-1]|uniref:Spurious ORF n=1 Tax=Halobacterium salinarum (strain ATCC 700922 / JCM 11081 / NRC-1) TaxID=64091 RepID=Q9HQB5_HALSA|nr:hypothetical protein VNG_1239H [Halobacterium salinarum NRC-1]DAC78317.1 TPA_inf: spurious ORF [Halobacterium salinarum NRC-1]